MGEGQAEPGRALAVPRLPYAELKTAIDESGFDLLPNMVRTYAPMGRIPILREWWTRDHLSAISAISPEGKRISMAGTARAISATSWRVSNPCCARPPTARSSTGTAPPFTVAISSRSSWPMARRSGFRSTPISRQEMRQYFQRWRDVTSLAAIASASVLMHACTALPGTQVDKGYIDKALVFSLAQPWPPRESIPASASTGHVRRQHPFTPSPVPATDPESCHPSSRVRPRAESSHR
jgi:hypothetical protein